MTPKEGTIHRLRTVALEYPQDLGTKNGLALEVSRMEHTALKASALLQVACLSG